VFLKWGKAGSDVLVSGDIIILPESQSVALKLQRLDVTADATDDAQIHHEGIGIDPGAAQHPGGVAGDLKCRRRGGESKEPVQIYSVGDTICHKPGAVLPFAKNQTDRQFDFSRANGAAAHASILAGRGIQSRNIVVSQLAASR